MAGPGMISGSAQILDFSNPLDVSSGVPSGGYQHPAKSTAFPSPPSGIQMDAAGMDEAFYQAWAGLEQMTMNMMAQGIDPNGPPDPTDPQSYRAKALLTQAKTQISHLGERLVQGKENL